MTKRLGFVVAWRNLWLDVGVVPLHLAAAPQFARKRLDPSCSFDRMTKSNLRIGVSSAIILGTAVIAACSSDSTPPPIAGNDAATGGDAPVTAGPFLVSGAVNGYAGDGLVIQNGADVLAIGKGATTYTFPEKFAAGSPLAITVQTQPTAPPQTCTIANGTGTITSDILNADITCGTSLFPVGGTVTGIAAGSNVVLQNNGGDDLKLEADGTFTFSSQVVTGSAYAVTVASSSGGSSCTVTDGAGTVASAAITNVAVVCKCSGSVTFGYTGALQSFAVPTCAKSITVDAYGAEGGKSTGENGGLSFPGGKGERAKGTFTPKAGDVLSILVGGKGTDSKCGSGGGGGSFVTSTSSGLLLAAGGGGGGFHCIALGGVNGVNGNVTTSGGGGSCTPTRTATVGGSGGSGGTSYYGGGGGGFASKGTGTNDAKTGGGAYPGAGGIVGGGYGGGGGYYDGCCGGSGGGGGYSGGSGGANDGCAGGGGGSYNAGTAPTMTDGVQAGHGTVTISY